MAQETQITRPLFVEDQHMNLVIPFELIADFELAFGSERTGVLNLDVVITLPKFVEFKERYDEYIRHYGKGNVPA